MTREEALKRFKAAKLTKFDAVTALEQDLLNHGWRKTC